jgi:Protein of unknown function (DUF3467)
MVNGDARATTTMPAPKVEAASLPDIEWHQSDKLFETYSNFVHANWAGDDVRLRFATLLPDAKGAGVNWTIEERCAVTLSWARAKDLHDLLVEVIQKYEEKNGEIRHGQAP